MYTLSRKFLSIESKETETLLSTLSQLSKSLLASINVGLVKFKEERIKTETKRNINVIKIEIMIVDAVEWYFINLFSQL